MTISEVIDRVDNSLPNTCDRAQKVRWLSELDHTVKLEIIDTHAGGEAVRLEPYDPDTDGERELLIPHPFDRVYLRWLEANIHKQNEDMKRWNNAIILYNSEWAAFAAWYHRTHKPCGGGEFRF